MIELFRRSREQGEGDSSTDQTAAQPDGSCLSPVHSFIFSSRWGHAGMYAISDTDRACGIPRSGAASCPLSSFPCSVARCCFFSPACFCLRLCISSCHLRLSRSPVPRHPPTVVVLQLACLEFFHRMQARHARMPRLHFSLTPKTFAPGH